MVAITRGGGILAFVNDEILSHIHHVGRNAHAILIIFFVFVQRVVLVDILHIWRGLIGRAILFRRMLSVYGIAVGIVDAFVALKNRHLCIVEVCATEIVVLIGRRRGKDGIVDFRTDNVADAVEILLIGGKLRFILA